MPVRGPLPPFGVRLHFASETRKYAKLTAGEPAKHTKYAHTKYANEQIAKVNSVHPLTEVEPPSQNRIDMHVNP